MRNREHRPLSPRPQKHRKTHLLIEGGNGVLEYSSWLNWWQLAELVSVFNRTGMVDGVSTKSYQCCLVQAEL